MANVGQVSVCCRCSGCLIASYITTLQLRCLEILQSLGTRRRPIQPLLLQMCLIRVNQVRLPVACDIIMKGDSSSRVSAGTTSDSTRTIKSKRRRRPVDSEIRANNAPFYFVNSTSSSKEKRAHVMRHHVQEKKRQRKLSHSALLPDHGPQPSSWPSEKEADLDANHQVKAPEISVGQNYSV